MLSNKALSASKTVQPAYIEDVFSTWLYTGTGAPLSINNGIDLSGKGGMTWFKGRNTATSHALFDTNRGAGYSIYSNATSAQSYFIDDLSAFNSNGFSLGDSATSGRVNASGYTYCSWTFRKAPKFFDVVTYTGDGVAGRTISHNLGSVPGMMIVKCTSTSGNWSVYHRSRGATERGILNLTNAFGANNTIWNDTEPTSTVFTVGDNAGVNSSGATYVAYLFAHNAGGFGAAGTDNIISCGSYIGNGSVDGPSINLGYEPQFLLVKRIDAASRWGMYDVMRGMSATGAQVLQANSSAAEFAFGAAPFTPTATGFKNTFDYEEENALGGTYIYMAIRRGPMKTPTNATSVFNVVARNGTGTTASVTSGFPVDLIIGRKLRSPAYTGVVDRLRGFAPQLSTQQTVAEVNDTTSVTAMGNTTVTFGDDSFNWGAFNQVYSSPASYAPWMFSRAPGFFDVVCYSGNSVNGQTYTHNLGVTPELVIIKARNSVRNWPVYPNTLSSGLYLNLDGSGYGTRFTSMSATTFGVSNDETTNFSGITYVAYLFASCPGVSKVGSYTGTGSTQTINAGLPTGARFVLIKRIDSTGDWWVWDTARGMVTGTDPRVTLNLTDAQINNDWVYTTTNGFQIVTSDATVNANGGTYIYLAIA